MTNLCDDVAVCFDTAANQLCAASFDSGGEIIIRRFPVRETTHAELVSWRNGLGHKTGSETVFRFVPNLFMEQTRLAMVEEDVASLPDAELTEWLVGAARGGTSGLDGKPVFETSLEKSVYDFTRLPNGHLSLTELPREALDLTRVSLLSVATPITSEELAQAQHFQTGGLPEFRQAVETRLRAVARYLSETESEYFASLAPDETVAVFAFTPEGVGFALWNPAYGFYVELGDFFHHTVEDGSLPDGMDKAEYLGQLYGESVYNFLNDQFYHRIVPEDDGHQPVNLKRTYWTAAANVVTPLEFLLREFSEQTDFPFVHAAAPMEEIIVSGLLLGTAPETTELVGSVNLANDIGLQYETVLDARQAVAFRRQSNSRRLALIYVLLPVACAIGLVAGLIANNWRTGFALTVRETTAASEKARLQPLLAARTEYEKTLAWYESVLRQIVGLRAKQTAALLFAARLDPLLPDTSAFYVSDLKLLAGGNFELRGLARDEFAVSEFVRSMEFASESEGAGDKRYFSGLTLEFKQGSQSDKPSSAASGVTGNLAPGISGFLVKGNFAPAAAIKAQEAKPPTAPITTTTATAANPAAPNQALPANNAAPAPAAAAPVKK